MKRLCLRQLVLGLLPLASLAAAPPGCSFLFVTEAPPNPRKVPYFDCTSSNALPIVDTVLAGVYGLATVGSLSIGSNTNSGGYGATAAALPLVALTAGLAASAIVGYRETATCREAKAELMQRLMQRDSAAPWGPNGPVPVPGAVFAPGPVDPWLHPGPRMGGAGTVQLEQVPPPFPAAREPAPPAIAPDGGVVPAPSDGGRR